MTTPPRWAGRKVQAATTWVIARDHGTCWICNHPGADTLDHLVPRSVAPELTWEPSNWRAAHGAAQPEFDCPGQYARGNYAGPRRPTSSPTSTTSSDDNDSREWRSAEEHSEFEKISEPNPVFGWPTGRAGSPASSRFLSPRVAQ